MIDRIVRWMLTRLSPYTVIRLVELPSGGNWMNVALSLTMDLRSSARSVTIQSSLRGKIAVSREMTDLLCVSIQLSAGVQRQHEPC